MNLDLTENQQRIVKLLEKAKANSKDAAVSIPRQTKQDKDDIFELRKLGLVGSANALAGVKGVATGSVVYWLRDQEEAVQTLTDAMSGDKEKHIKATEKLLIELNAANDEVAVLNAQVKRLETVEIELLKKVEELQQNNLSQWQPELNPKAEYAISSAYMQRKQSLDELIERAKSETIKHAKPRTIYQIIKLGVMTPNVTANFKEL